MYSFIRLALSCLRCGTQDLCSITQCKSLYLQCMHSLLMASKGSVVEMLGVCCHGHLGSWLPSQWFPSDSPWLPRSQLLTPALQGGFLTLGNLGSLTSTLFELWPWWHSLHGASPNRNMLSDPQRRLLVMLVLIEHVSYWAWIQNF